MYILIHQSSKTIFGPLVCEVWSVNLFQWFNTSKYLHPCVNRGLGCSRKRIMNAGELLCNEELLCKRITIVSKHVVLRANKLMKSGFLWFCVLWLDFLVSGNIRTAGEAFPTSFFMCIIWCWVRMVISQKSSFSQIWKIPGKSKIYFSALPLGHTNHEKEAVTLPPIFPFICPGTVHDHSIQEEMCCCVTHLYHGPQL